MSKPKQKSEGEGRDGSFLREIDVEIEDIRAFCHAVQSIAEVQNDENSAALIRLVWEIDKRCDLIETQARRES